MTSRGTHRVQSTYDAVLFDLDGVLADTEGLKALAHQLTINYFGGISSWTWYAAVIGQPFLSVMRHFADKAGIIQPDVTEYRKLYLGKYQNLLHKHLKAMPGAKDLLSAVSVKYPTAVVSSSEREVVEEILVRLKMVHSADLVISADDVRHQKPNPEPYVLAAVRIGSPNHRCLVFEDTQAGVASAAEAGSDIVGVRHALNTDEQLRGAKLIVSSMLQRPKIDSLLEMKK